MLDIEGRGHVDEPSQSTRDLVAEHREQGRLLMRGFLTLYVLRLLSERPRYGNELISAIEHISEGGWVPSAGAIYPLLRRLEADRLVIGSWEQSDYRPRRFYKLTDAGLVELDRLLREMRPQIDRAIRTLQQHRRFLFSEEAPKREDNTSIGG
ncbi:MAG: PadR family transcriptional regulator [Chloroflexota bacterium]